MLVMLLGYGISLLPLILVRPHLQMEPFLGAFFIWLFLFAVSLPFVVRMIIRRTWFFRGNGEPVIRDLLESMLMGVNDFNAPVSVSKKRGKLIFSWRCNEPQWCERMVLEDVRKNYELRLKFDGDTRTVSMIDRVRSVDFDLCPIKVKTGFLARPRFYCGVKTGQQWGLKNFKQTTADQYRFKPQELKSPVFNSIIAHGWNVRLDIF
jgi:hypothetical protein